MLQFYLLNSLFKILFGVFVVVKFYPWFQFYFPLIVKSLSYISHTPKQKKIKLKPKVKLNFNIIYAEDNLQCKDHQSHRNSSRHVQDPSQTVLMNKSSLNTCNSSVCIALNENDKHCSRIWSTCKTSTPFHLLQSLTKVKCSVQVVTM